ncbi:MAG: UDP-N-acetylmuramoyl-tripeptide--D-alanyl-D-alanine ligase [Bacteroidales bacterium]
MNLEQIYNHYLEANSVTIDSREIYPGSIFFALKGDRFNGNEYAAEAIQKGSKFAVVDEEKYAKDNRYILVDNVLKTLQALAHHHRKQLTTQIIAITGSNGKTTTKELSQKVLEKQFNVLSNIKNYNNHIGLPLTLLNLKEYHDYAIVEMGANHRGEIEALCNIAEPESGLITNIGKAHLEGFGSFEGVRKAKGELYDFLNQNNGVIFYNADNSILKEMTDKFSCAKYSYGTHENSFCQGQLINTEPFIEVNTQFGKVSPQLIGEYNFENIMAALCIGKYFNINFDNIKQAIEEYIPENNRSQLIKTKSNTVILDAYNANPSSMQAAISNFANLKEKSKILILGDMFELGKYSKEEHRNLIEYLTRYNFEKVFLVGNNFYALQQNNYPVYKTTDEFISFLRQNPLDNHHILIKGSRGMTLEKITKYL